MIESELDRIEILTISKQLTKNESINQLVKFKRILPRQRKGSEDNRKPMSQFIPPTMEIGGNRRQQPDLKTTNKQVQNRELE